MIAALLSFAVAATVPMAALPVPPGCNSPRSQSAMTLCADAQYRAADASMTGQWRLTLARMRARDAADRSRGGGFGYGAALLESQRAWLRWRDTQCVIEGARYSGGSLQRFEQVRCRSRLTIERTRQLRGMMWRD